MRHGRHLMAAALAGPLAFSLVAATAPSTAPVGTASTTLSAAELTITSPVGGASLGLVDAATFASTATDTAVNAAGAPFASALLTPLTGPAGPVGRAEARSDGKTSVSSSVAALDALGGPIADISGTVAPAALSATATAEEAHAVIGTLTAEIAGLADALGVTVTASDVASRVTATQATATQGLQVSDLGISLGDIVPQDVLAGLPLPDLLKLLKALPVELPADVDALIDDLEAAIDALGDQLTALAGTKASISTSTSELSELLAVLKALNELAALEDQLALLDPDETDLGTIDDAVGVIEDSTGVSTDPLTDVISTLSTTGDCSTALTAADLQACIDALETELLASVDAASKGDLEALIAQLVEEIAALVEVLVTQIEGLVPLIRNITAIAAGLEDLLAQLNDLLADAAGLPLVGLSSVDIGVNSLSDGTLEGSSASVGCEAVTVRVLDESLTTPSCDQGLAAVRDTASLVSGLVGSLTETLNVLPLTDVLTTGDLKVEVFTDLQESVVEEGGQVVATAGVTVLDLEIPSITIDPDPVTDLLDGLGLPDVVGTVEALLGETLTEVQALGLDALDTVEATLVDASGDLEAAGGVADLVAQLEAILAGLDLGALGTLDSISTPSVALVIDPVSTASFSTSAAAVPTDPTGGPAPAPAPGPSLPATGGGLAVLGLATLAGAASLRRRG